MNEFVVKILSTGFITPDVKQITVDKPKGYTYTPGQATEISINKPGLKEEKRPFSFTSLNNWMHLEFTIKIYADRNGVTKEIEKLQIGDELIIRKPFGTITYKGPGVFIAGGAGITPFIAIFRQLYREGKAHTNTLLFSNKTRSDVILHKELKQMLKSNYFNIFTREGVVGFMENRIDENYLIAKIKNFSQNFYVCGPEKFVKDINDMLLKLGARPDTLVFEK
jgi:ferredoxin-NADP reductase